MRGLAVLKQYSAEPPPFRFWYSLPSANTTICLQMFRVRMQNHPLDPGKLDSLAIGPLSRVIEIRRKLHDRQPLADCMEDP
jgi:hypothetical protein